MQISSKRETRSGLKSASAAIVNLRAAQVGIAETARNEHFAAWDQCCAVQITCRRHGTGLGEALGRRIIQLGARQETKRSEAACNQNFSIGQTCSPMIVTALTHGTDRDESSCDRVIN